MDELLFTAELLRYGVDLAVDIFKTEKRVFSLIPSSKKIEFSGRLNDLIGRFEKLWLLRNRPGGLEDSLDVFRKLDAKLKT